MSDDGMEFPGGYSYKVLDTLPATEQDALEFYIGRRPKHPGEFLIVEVRPFGGMYWIGKFEYGPEDYPLSGVYKHPSSDHVCVVANGQGYIVPVYAPTEWKKVLVAPILGMLPMVEQQVLLFWSFQDLAAYDPGGLKWWVERLSEDNLSITDISGGVIRGTAWDPVGEREAPFSVDPVTGRVTGGWGNPSTH